MALHDTRVFSDGRKFWVVQILSASGGGWGEGPFNMTHEGAYFRELADETNQMRHHTLPAGYLNKIDHSSIVSVLNAAKPFGSAIRMVLSNPIHREDWPSQTVVDDEGLEWVFKSTTQPRLDLQGGVTLQPAVRFACLDDSALQSIVALQDAATFDQFRLQTAGMGLRAIIDSIKGSFQRYVPSDVDVG